MKMNTEGKSLLLRAVEFAERKHAGQFRKGTEIPYITHPLEVMDIVSGLTEDEEVRAAAVLHDTLEDTDTTKEELVRNFGPRVADLVEAESENKREDRPAAETWMIRKQETIRHLGKAGTDVRMIALGDKLSNVRAMSRDYKAVGEKLWERFNEKNPVLQGMYYGLLGNVFGEDEKIRETDAFREYMELCKGLFSGTYDGDGNLIEDGNEEKEEKKEAEFFPGIPMTPVLENLREWLVNPHWREYYQTAPSRWCRTLITLEFWYSETESEAAAEAMNLLEEKLSAEDWDHLYRYCGNNPRKEYIRRRRDLASGRGKNSMPDNPAN